MTLPTVIDFETKGIKRRPAYPPKPVSYSTQRPWDRYPRFRAWGHPWQNNCTEEEAYRELKDAWLHDDSLLFQHAKFDTDVAVTHFKLPQPDWRRVHDTEYLLFLHNPHARSLSLKPSAEAILGWPPEERDELRDWIIANVPEAHKKRSEWGAYISEAPGRLVGRYAKGDVRRTLGLFKHLFMSIANRGMLDAYNRERRLMPILLSNERQGIRVDLPRLERDVKMYEEAMAKCEQWLRKALHAPNLNFDSDRDVADALDKAGVITEWKYTAPTKTHPGGVKSIAKKNMSLDMFHNKRVRQAYGYQARLRTCLSMFMRTWLEQARRTGGLVHTDWNQVRQSRTEKGSVGARTSRLSSSPNFLNLATDWLDKDDGYQHPEFLRVPLLPLIRQYFLPDPGGVWIKRDYAQQEYRVFAHFENDHLMRKYNEDDKFDIHDEVGALIKMYAGLELQRRQIKIINFGDLYGLGAAELAMRLHITVAQAKQLKAAKRAALPGFVKLDEEIKARAANGLPIYSWGGAEIYCEAPAYSKKYKRHMTFEYKMLNYLIQRSSAECTKEATIFYDQAKKESRFLLTVHDEMDCSTPSKKLVKTEMAVLKDVMESIRFDVPMLSDGSTGVNWAELKDYRD